MKTVAVFYKVGCKYDGLILQVTKKNGKTQQYYGARLANKKPIRRRVWIVLMKRANKPIRRRHLLDHGISSTPRSREHET